MPFDVGLPFNRRPSRVNQSEEEDVLRGALMPLVPLASRASSLAEVVAAGSFR